MRTDGVTVCFIVAGVAAVAAGGAASAQDYPARPIRMVVAFAPGGAPDIIGRIVGQRLHDGLGQPVIVDNRPGATGNIGAEIVARAAPDGHTLFLATLSVAISPSFFRKLAFDPVTSFSPVGMVASVPLLLVVHPSLPAGSLKELIVLAKSQPGRFNYASVGTGSPQHLSAELFKSVAGVNLWCTCRTKEAGRPPRRYCRARRTCFSPGCRRRCRTSGRGGCARWRCPPPGARLPRPTCPR